jgi:hypothetical protein
MKIFFIFIIFLFSVSFISAECGGCLENEQCYYVGTLIEKEGVMNFCDISGSFLNVKPDGESCQNDFECSSGLCSSAKCVDLYKETTETSENIKNIFADGESDSGLKLSKSVKNFILIVIGIIVLFLLLILFYLWKKYNPPEDETHNNPPINAPRDLNNPSPDK